MVSEYGQGIYVRCMGLYEISDIMELCTVYHGTIWYDDVWYAISMGWNTLGLDGINMDVEKLSSPPCYFTLCQS